MGNVYNVQQAIKPENFKSGEDKSQIGLDEWKRALRKELMEKLRQYSPDQIDKIIANTFGSTYYS
jgi:restriction endonuclease Mrr